MNLPFMFTNLYVYKPGQISNLQFNFDDKLRPHIIIRTFSVSVDVNNIHSIKALQISDRLHLNSTKQN